MAGDTSTVQPTNKIVVDSTNLHETTKNVETATNVYPGRLVMKGTNDDDIIVCDGSTAHAVGWASYEHTAKKYRPATVDTVYAENAKIAVVWGPGIRVLARINACPAITVGMLLKAGADGTVTPGTAGTDDIIAQAEEAKAAGAAADIIVRSLI